MEAFSLLKYWRRTGGGFATGGGGRGLNSRDTTDATTTLVTAVTRQALEDTEEDEDDDDDDDGPFFDLEFAVQDEAEGDFTKSDEENNDDENEPQNDDAGSHDDSSSTDVEEDEEDEEDDFNFTISSDSTGNDRADPNLAVSPSDDLFFKGRLVPIEPSSRAFDSAEPNSKPQFPVSLMKSATKLRVSMLGFKKSKQNASGKPEKDNGSVNAMTSDAVVADNMTTKQKQETEKEEGKEKQIKLFTVKFKVEEVPIMSLLTRDANSSRKPQKQNVVEVSEEKKFSKDVMQRYLKKVKPLYIRVSKRYGEKLKFSGQLNSGSATNAVKSTPLTAGHKPNPVKSTAEKSLTSEAEVGGEALVSVRSQKQGNNIPERLKVVCKNLGKSRSASSAVAAAAPAAGGVVAASRRDDSLLQQQDGIQSAILHCKRSFNASRESDSSFLTRSVSDPSSHQKFDLSRKSSDQGNKVGSFEP